MAKMLLLIMSKEISPPYVTHRSGMSWVQKGFYIYREYYVHTHRAAREYGHLNFVIWILWLHFAKNIIFFKKCLDQGIFPIQSTFRVHTYGSISIHKESCRVLCMYIAKERWILDYWFYFWKSLLPFQHLFIVLEDNVKLLGFVLEILFNLTPNYFPVLYRPIMTGLQFYITLKSMMFLYLYLNNML